MAKKTKMHVLKNYFTFIIIANSKISLLIYLNNEHNVKLLQ